MKFIRPTAAQASLAQALRFDLLPAGGAIALSGDLDVLGLEGWEMRGGRNLFAHLMERGHEPVARKVQHHLKVARQRATRIAFTTRGVTWREDNGVLLAWSLEPVLGDERMACEVQLRRKPAAETARADLLAGCLERVNDLIIVTEADELDQPGPAIVYVNRAFEKRTGYTAAEVVGRSPRFLQGPGTDPAVRQRMRRALEAVIPLRVEVRNYTKSGEAFWIESELAPVLDSNGWVTHWVAVQRDITERKVADEAIEVGRARLETAQQLGHLGEWEMSPDGARVAVSSRLELMLGLDAGAFPRDRAGWVARVAPEEREAFDAALAALRDTGEEMCSEIRVGAADGTWRWWRVLGGVRRDEAGQVNLLSGTAQDVTEAHELQQDLENVFVLAFDLISILGRDGVFRQVNPSFTRVLGHAPESLVGRAVIEFVHPDDRDSMASELGRVAVGGTLVSHVARMRAAGGSWHVLQWTAVPDLARGMVYAVARDITGQVGSHDRREEGGTWSEAAWDGMPDGCLAVDRGWRVVRANRGAAGLLRQPAAGLTGRDWWAIHPEPVAAGLRAEAEQAMRGGVPATWEAAWGKAGTWLEVRLVPGAGGALLFVRDVTQRRRRDRALRESEERLRQAVETSHDLVWRADATGRLTFAGGATERVCGRCPAELVGRTVWELVAPGDVDRVKRELGEAAGRGADFVELEHELACPGAEPVPVRVRVAFQRDALGRLVWMGGTSRDSACFDKAAAGRVSQAPRVVAGV